MGWLLKIFLLASIYVCTARIGQLFAIPPGNVTPVWLPSGIMLAALAIWGRGLWPGVFIGAFIGNAWAYFDPSSLGSAMKGLAAATMNGTGDSLCALIGLWALSIGRPEGDAFLKNPKNALAFVCLSAALGSLVSALFGVGGLLMVGFAPWENGLSIFFTWVLGDMMGIVILFPFIVALRELLAKPLGQGLNLEFVALLTSFIFVLYSMATQGPVWYDHVVWVFLIISILLWGAFRFPWAWTPVLMLVLSATMILENIFGLGPFAHDDLNKGLLETQYYLLIAATTSLMVASEVIQRRRLFKENLELTRDLEQKVEEQTRELRQEMEEKSEIQKELLFQEKAYKQAQSLANIGHWCLDHSTGELTWSDETYAIYEQDPKRVKPSYEKLLNAIHPCDREKVKSLYADSLANKKPYEIEHRLLFDDGRVKHVFENCLTKFSDEGAPLYSLGTVQDISKEFEVKADLIEAKERAEDANLAKMNFLSMMSHELRTPMNGVLGMAQLMEFEPDLSDNARTYLKTITRCGENLVEILTSVLDFAKIDSGKQDIRKCVFNANNMVDSVCSLFEGVARSKGIDLINAVEIPEISKVYGDDDKVRRILINLIGNAVKYTEMGSVKVTAELKDLNEDEVKIRLCVADTGIGIPRDRIKGIFNSFEQANSSLSRKYGGTGLGLAITKSLTQLLGGRIDCESEEGVGSRFYVELPLEFKAETSGDSAGQSPKSNVKLLSGKVVLVVEDDADNLTVTCELLKRLGLEVDVAQDGRQALQKAQENKYDLIYMDIVLPELSGLEVTKIIREERGPNKATRIVALTALASKEDEARCLELGISEVVKKPLNVGEFNTKTFFYLS